MKESFMLCVRYFSYASCLDVEILLAKKVDVQIL